jgi:electron transport complex protein RnfB
VDAIVGAAKLMHTVVADLCTGCELCLPPCPVDCISMPLAKPEDANWTEDRASLARQRHRQRKQRLASDQAERETRLRPANTNAALDPDAEAQATKRRAIVQQAIERARARVQGKPDDQSERS